MTPITNSPQSDDNAARSGLAERLRVAGLRVTGPRVAILGFLAEDRTHPTAEQICVSLAKEHPSLSLSTVYATLETFARTGLIRRLHGGSGKVRVDGTAPDHDHALCRLCGSVFDVGRDLVPRPDAPPRLPSGMAVTDMHITYEVECPDCRPAGETPSLDTDTSAEPGR